MSLKTPFYEKHIENNGRMVDFAGFLLPVQYEGIIAEHNAVRNSAGLFDVSHMTEFILSGRDALKNLDCIFTNSFETLKVGVVRYTPMCYPDGGTVDDLLVYRLCDERYMLVGNACNHQKDFDHIKSLLKGDVKLVDNSDFTAQLALQGPMAEQVVAQLTDQQLPQKYYTFKENVVIAGVNCLVSTTGYTGEKGYEFYCEADGAGALFDALASNKDVTLCGIGCRDTLRFEAAMPLYGHELSEKITPIQCSLEFAVKLQKPAFLGKEALSQPASSSRIGLKLLGRGIARGEEKVFLGDRCVGFITSGTHCPTLGGAYAMAIVEKGEDTEFEIEIRSKRVSAEKCELPFI